MTPTPPPGWTSTEDGHPPAPTWVEARSHDDRTATVYHRGGGLYELPPLFGGLGWPVAAWRPAPDPGVKPPVRREVENARAW